MGGGGGGAEVYVVVGGGEEVEGEIERWGGGSGWRGSVGIL